MLKNHTNGFSTQFSKRGFSKLVNLLTCDHNVTRAWLDESIDMANQRRLAGTRQAHDAEYLAFGNTETRVTNTQYAIEFISNGIFAY